MSQAGFKTILFQVGCSLTIIIAPPGVHATVTDLAVAADTFIDSRAPDSNAGGNIWFDAGADRLLGVRRGLLRFDLSAIPSGSTVTSAVLQLTLLRAPISGGIDSVFDLFRLTASWNEGTGTNVNGSPAKPGEATWNARMFGSVPWSTPGAKADAVSTSSASAAVGSTLNTTYSWSGSNLVADVQLWVENPALNLGWLLVSQAEASPQSVRGFAARENGTNFGVLQVGYTAGGPPQLSPARFTSITVSNRYPTPPLTTTNVPIITNGLVTLRWLGGTNGKCDLLYSASVGSNAVWKLGQANVLADPSGSNFLSDPPCLASPVYKPNTRLFYRLNVLPAPAPALPARLQIVASNFVSPTVLTHAGDGSSRLFVADQTGQIWIIDRTGKVLAEPFLDVSTKLVTLRTNYDERGLLGLAFHPGYSTNGRCFIYYAAPPPNTNYDSMTVLSEFHVAATNANLADPASERVLLTILQPEANDKGATLAFGPDTYLYLGTGDGGGAGDQHGAYGNAQVLTNLLGKMLRIDVNTNSTTLAYGIPPDNPFVGTPAARPEIYAYGFRNPWRFSFDRGGTRQGFIADVGQNLWEEVDILRKGSNYGWRILEGSHVFDPTVATALGIDVASLDFPIFEYGHGPMGIAIIGGFVYRGTAYPALAGKYVFGDFSTNPDVPDGQLFYLDETRPGIWEHFAFQLPNGARLGRFVKSLGEDEQGELYLLSSTQPGPAGNTGDVRKLVAP